MRVHVRGEQVKNEHVCGSRYGVSKLKMNMSAGTGTSDQVKDEHVHG